MKILMLGRWVPAPRRPVRATREYQFARHLARGHQLTIAFVTDNPDTAGAISALRSDFGDLEFASVPRGWKSLASAVSLASGESCTLSYFRSEALRTRLRDRLSRTRYDLLFVSASGMIQYGLEADPAIPMVVDFGSVGSEWWMQEAKRGSFPGTRFFRTEGIRLRIAETAAVQRASLCVAETPRAADIVESLVSRARAVVIPSGVDVDAFPPRPPRGRVPTVVFDGFASGSSEDAEAMDFASKVLPMVRARVPQVRVVVGKGDGVNLPRPTATFREAEVLRTADARLVFHDQAVAATPVRAGRDLRKGVLEAMAAGVPLVTSGSVCEYLAAENGRELYAADDPAGFTERLVELLLSGTKRERMGSAGRQLIQTKFSWDVLAARLEDLLVDVVGGKRNAAGTVDARATPAVLGG
jgi:polysaccharide biosynthesis protein PslH